MIKFTAQEREMQISHLCKDSLYSFSGWDGPYKFGKSKVLISCKKHGCHSLHLNSVLHNGSRCPACGGRKKWSKEEREIQILEKHSIYAFEGWVDAYKNAHSRVKMGCKIHGSWEISVHNLINGGYGCPACGDVQMALKRKTPLQEIMNRINRMEQILNCKFVSFKNGYKNVGSQIVMECPKHGNFETTLRALIHKYQACPGCSPNGYNKFEKGYVYLLESEDKKYLKIGITNNVRQRERSLKEATPFSFKMIRHISFEDGKQAIEIEKIFHNTFENAGLRGFGGATEWVKHTTQIEKWFDFLG
ncbi:hypothetical protein AAM22_gp74 [Pantoea phage vB_PagM_AAM22]|nr:hypothetical protein AAM22_gp74 [Pantoea phage vB_PagM_AAM22]